MEQKRDFYIDPVVTPSVAGNIPTCLREMLVESSMASQKKRTVLISSNSLANRFILNRWGIRPSQRRKFRTLFTTIRKYCRNLFHYLANQSRMEWTSGTERFIFGVYKFEEIRGNLILGFVKLSIEDEWTIPS